MKNKKRKAVLARIMYVLTVLFVMVIFVMLGPDEIPAELEVPFYILNAVVFLVILIFFHIFSNRVISFWEAFFFPFDQNDGTAKEKRSCKEAFPLNNIILSRLTQDDREQFIKDNQEAFNYGALEGFGCRDDHYEEEGEIISRRTIEESIDRGEAYRIMLEGKPVGGVVVRVDGEHGDLDLLFVSPHLHSKGIGFTAWCAVEKMYPEVALWETVTPYFEKRNIHFYVNRCGFHIVEFFNSHHPDPNDPDAAEQTDEPFGDGMFRFEKRTKE